MKVFVFDLLAYGETSRSPEGRHRAALSAAREHFKADVAVRTYAEHLDAWEEIDRLGYDGVGFNEHHCSPYGLMNSPNLMAAAAAQRTKKAEAPDLRQSAAAARAAAARRGAGDARLPVERPADLRLRARHPARIPGAQRAARRIPARASRRPTTSSPRAWTEEVFSYRASSGRTRTWRSGRGRCSSRIRRSGCRSPAARNRSSSPASTTSPITPGLGSGGLQRGHHPLLRQMPRRRRPPHHAATISRSASIAYVADSKAQAVKENGALSPLFQPHPVQPRQFHRDSTAARRRLYVAASTDYVRPENRRAAERAREDFRNMTMDDVARQAENMPLGHAPTK